MEDKISFNTTPSHTIILSMNDNSEIGRIYFDLAENTIKFKGNAEESAKVFAEIAMQHMVQYAYAKDNQIAELKKELEDTQRHCQMYHVQANDMANLEKQLAEANDLLNKNRHMNKVIIESLESKLKRSVEVLKDIEFNDGFESFDVSEEVNQAISILTEGDR